MTTTTKQTPHSRMTDRARYRLPASTTVDPTAHGSTSARKAADLTTHEHKTKQVQSQCRPLKSQSRSKTVANRPRNRRSKHAQSPTLPPHAPQPKHKVKKRFCLQKTMPTDGGQSDTRPNKSSKTDKNAARNEDRAAKSDQTAKIHAKIRLL